MMRYPPDEARREVAVIAAGLHWSYESLMTMDHAERRCWARIAPRTARKGE
jgi:hypothetical protein